MSEEQLNTFESFLDEQFLGLARNLQQMQKQTPNTKAFLELSDVIIAAAIKQAVRLQHLPSNQ